MRLVLLTGGSSGIGLALVRQLEACGDRIVEFSRRAPHAFSHAVDLADPLVADARIRAVLAQIPLEGIREVLVISNAGVLVPIGPAANAPTAAVTANLQTGLVGAIVFINAVVAQFQHLALPKRLVNISSGAADKGYAGWSLYCAAKAGLENFIRALALEQAAQAHPFLAVNLLPGVVDTAMQAEIRASTEGDFPQRERFVQLHADGVLACADEVARRALRILARPDLRAGERYDVRVDAG